MIEKVVLDHEVKASSSNQILPLVPEIEAHLDRIAAEEGDRRQVVRGRADGGAPAPPAHRRATDDAFEAESAGLRESWFGRPPRGLGAEPSSSRAPWTAGSSWRPPARTAPATPRPRLPLGRGRRQDPTPVVEDDPSGGEHSSTSTSRTTSPPCSRMMRMPRPKLLSKTTPTRPSRPARTWTRLRGRGRRGGRSSSTWWTPPGLR